LWVQPPPRAPAFKFRFSFKTLHGINGLESFALIIRLGNVAWNMGQITLEPEQKPEQWLRTEGNGDSDGLAMGFKGLW
jgi:hypothetical protein